MFQIWEPLDTGVIVVTPRAASVNSDGVTTTNMQLLLAVIRRGSV